MAEHSSGDTPKQDREYSPEQSNLIDYASRLVEGQPLIYQNHKYKEVPTNPREKLRRFVTGIDQFMRPLEYMRYVRTKAVPREVQKIYAEDDREYTRMITASYVTDDKGSPTETLTGLAFTKELSTRYSAGLSHDGLIARDSPLTVDLLDSSVFAQDNEMRQASGLADAIAFVDRHLASRVDVRKATS